MIYEVFYPGQENRCMTDEVVDFLFEHLDKHRQFPETIEAQLNKALSPQPGEGGFVIIASEHDQITGVVVVNEKVGKDHSLKFYLTYLAVHKSFRGKRVGYVLTEKALHESNGKLIVPGTSDNLAVQIFEKVKSQV